MRTENLAHTLIGIAALALMGGGSWVAWGPGYSALFVGGLLLAGVIYARTR